VRAGIPVRPAIAQALGKTETHTQPSVLIFGGSQGARAINNIVVQAAPGWVKRGWRVVHQTGAADFATMQKQYEGSGVDVREFIHDMAAAYQASDVIVCRAGASSL